MTVALKRDVSDEERDQAGRWTGGMSAEEATTRLSAAFPGIRVSLDKMDQTLRNRVVLQLEMLGKAYPEVHLTGIGTQPSNTKGMGRNIAYAPLYGSTIHLNEAQFRSAAKMATLDTELASYKERTGRDWTVTVKGEPEDAITHEFGHLVDGQLLGMVGGGPGMPIISDYARKSGAAYTEGFAEAFVQAANGMDTPAAKYVNDKVTQARSWRSGKLEKYSEDQPRDEAGRFAAADAVSMAPSVQPGFEPDFESEKHSFPATGPANGFTNETRTYDPSRGPKYTATNIGAYDAGGRLVGTFSIAHGGGQDGYFKISVNPDAQRQGWGFRLLKEAERQGIDLEAVAGKNRYTPSGRALLRAYFSRTVKVEVSTVAKVSGLAFADAARSILRQGYAAAYLAGKKVPARASTAPPAATPPDEYDRYADDQDWYGDLDDDGQDAVDDSSDGLNDRLLGLGALLLGGAVSAAMLDAWMGTYANSLNPLFEDGFQAGVNGLGEVQQATWVTEDDEACELCDPRNGMTWVGDEIDAAMPHPGEGGFGGPICDGGWRCRCSIDYEVVPADQATYSMGGYDEPEGDVEAMSTADLLKVWAITAKYELTDMPTSHLLTLRSILAKYSDDQPRDDHGRWTSRRKTARRAGRAGDANARSPAGGSLPGLSGRERDSDDKAARAIRRRPQ